LFICAKHLFAAARAVQRGPGSHHRAKAMGSAFGWLGNHLSSAMWCGWSLIDYHGDGNSRTPAGAGTISAKMIKIQKMTAACNGIVLSGSRVS
jgi:hypothetical protein